MKGEGGFMYTGQNIKKNSGVKGLTDSHVSIITPLGYIIPMRHEMPGPVACPMGGEIFKLIFQVC